MRKFRILNSILTLTKLSTHSNMLNWIIIEDSHWNTTTVFNNINILCCNFKLSLIHNYSFSKHYEVKLNCNFRLSLSLPSSKQWQAAISIKLADLWKPFLFVLYRWSKNNRLAQCFLTMIKLWIAYINHFLFL